MAERTYVPELINILRRLCLYIIRYREKIKANSPVGTADALDALLEACNALTTLLPVDLPTE